MTVPTRPFFKLKGKCKPSILFIDKRAIVISKPHGIVSQLGERRSSPEKTLEMIIDDVAFALGESSFQVKPVPVHRLDKVVEEHYHIDISFQETTGALLLARSPEALKAFSQQFSSREVQKTYLALVRGGCQTFSGKSGDIGVTLAADKTGKTCISKSEKGTMTYTSWELLGSSRRAPVSLLKLELQTGFKHQLRVHLAQVLKAPVLGDTFHSHSLPCAEIRKVAKVPPARLFLHAAHISFFRYRKTAPRRYLVGVSAPLPKDFAQLCKEFELEVDARYLTKSVSVNDEDAPSDLTGFDKWWDSKVNSNN